jgi:hypothetical protein
MVRTPSAADEPQTAAPEAQLLTCGSLHSLGSSSSTSTTGFRMRGTCVQKGLRQSAMLGQTLVKAQDDHACGA